ncbi:MAG: rhomboid family intramembrane serine protease [Actinomycetota bacterium]|nr:rhomboid family intramembrane serine protease [Actinomycetota bacterium]
MAETCYRHPKRETGVSCSNCGRPICPECMTSTSVGMRCPECASDRTKVRTAASVRAGGGVEPLATYALLAVNVVAFVAEIMSGAGGDKLLVDGGICANAIAGDGGLCGIQNTVIVSDGDEIFRIVSGGFLHAGPVHLLFNMFALYILGTLLEPAIGHLRFLGIYFAALLAGSFGALLLSDPNEITVGASGGIFGLMGAAFVIARNRGVDQIASQIGVFVVLNLVFTFAIPGISIGGHIGGLIGGSLAALLVTYAERRQTGTTGRAIEAAGILLIVVASVAGALLAAGASAEPVQALPL